MVVLEERVVSIPLEEHDVSEHRDLVEESSTVNAWIHKVAVHFVPMQRHLGIRDMRQQLLQPAAEGLFAVDTTAAAVVVGDKDRMWRQWEIQQSVAERDNLAQKPGQQQAVAEIAMQLLSTAFLAAEDIEIFVAVVEVVVVV